MILLSVGTQLPFDRLIRAVDEWAQREERDDVVGQIGPSTYRPAAIRHFRFMDPDRFSDLQRQCSVFISHAGMGSIITALELGKPIIVMARDHRLGEHRNGHQFATVRQYADTPGVHIAGNVEELADLLIMVDDLAAPPPLTELAPSDFTDQLTAYLNTPRRPSLTLRFRRFFN